MKIATSVAMPVVIALLYTGTPTAGLANTPISRSLVDRCMSEPVSNDHLSCGNVYRQAYVRARLKSKFPSRSNQTSHRHPQVVAAHFIRPKPAFKRASVSAVHTARAVMPAKRLGRVRKIAHLGSYSLASAAPRLVVVHPRQIAQANPRMHQASALCSQPSYRSSWECGRYFLLAPYQTRTR